MKWSFRPVGYYNIPRPKLAVPLWEYLAVSVWKYPNGTGWARRAEFPPHPPSARLALPARPKLLSEGGNRSGKDDFKFFFGGN